MASSHYCAWCNYETDEKRCPLCSEVTEQLNVKDDPLFGTVAAESPYTNVGSEDQSFL